MSVANIQRTMRPNVFDCVTFSRRSVMQLLIVALFIACVTLVDFSRLNRHSMSKAIKFDYYDIKTSLVKQIEDDAEKISGRIRIILKQAPFKLLGYLDSPHKFVIR
jgi:hypothetical protein